MHRQAHKHTSSDVERPLRIQLHSHDSFGLGHLRRTMTIAAALRSRLKNASILITTGSPCATQLSNVDGVDVIKLPSVTKDGAGSYVARSLQLEISSIVEIRRRLLLEIQRSFSPDVIIVDHQVLGLADELDLVLESARSSGTKTILGVRDIIDTPDVVAREWGRPRARRALAEEYDRICVYGDPTVFDTRREYPIPVELRERLEFVGYVARPDVPARAQRGPGTKPRVLVTVGGGEDGAGRIEAYLDALALSRPNFESTIVLGPLHAQESARSLKKRLREIPGVDVQVFHADIPHLLSKADAVVSMAGYNSVVEILQSGVPAVLWPRVFPRREQLMRAERMQQLGLAECFVSPSAHALRAAIERALLSDRSRGALPPLNGAERVTDVVIDLCSKKMARTAEAAR